MLLGMSAIESRIDLSFQLLSFRTELIAKSNSEKRKESYCIYSILR